MKLIDIENILKMPTPLSWGKEVLAFPLALLSDHAYLERKAASNALELFNRWPEPRYPKLWSESLSSIARDETMHLNQVIEQLRKRGGRLQRLHRNQYATDLHGLIRRGQGPLELMDRLLVSGLIEARSCERFSVLSHAADDAELGDFYRALHHAEMGHYTVFLTLAEQICEKSVVESRWNELVEFEAKIMALQPTGPRIHSGVSS